MYYNVVVRYDRTVVAYHGCDAHVAEQLLRGEAFRKSRNDYDWLGEGTYFWEFGATSRATCRSRSEIPLA